MNVLKAIWEWFVWFRYKSPVRNFGSDRLDDLRQGYRAVALGDPLSWVYYIKCFPLSCGVLVRRGQLGARFSQASLKDQPSGLSK
jgi:hypothetical protein